MSATLAIAALSAQYASAQATVGAESVPGSTGLPDGRVYEQVSPANKHGNEVNYLEPAFVSSNGQAVMYGASGALVDDATNSSIPASSVSERTNHGWVTRSATPAPVPGEHSEDEYVNILLLPDQDVPSDDLSHVLFGTFGLQPFVGSPDEPRLTNNIYLTGPDPFAEPEWVGRSQIEGEPGGEGGAAFSLYVAGSSPDLKTIYFQYASPLLHGASGLYRYREGVLSDAGVLPNGETSSGKAFAAAQDGQLSGRFGHEGLPAPAGFDNQVSEDGSHVFFVRKDEAGQLELYAHVTAPDGSQTTMLISQSQLPGHVGQPAPAGPLAMPSTERQALSTTLNREAEGTESWPSFVFASPDGSHAFFQSANQLTEAAPAGSTPKTYVFDLETGELEYLPAVTGPIVTVGSDGSWLLFENTAHTPFQLERWVAGAAGGSAASIAQLPSVTPSPCGAVLCVGPAYVSRDGKVVVFATESPIPGFNDGGGHYEFYASNELGEYPERLIPDNREIFRWEAEADQLSCVSCPSKGVTPASDAVMSPLDFYQNATTATGGAEVITPGRAVTDDGGKVFFETRDALVPQDTNGTVDVYGWEDGKVYLISSGHSPQASHLIGTSESGGDAFFMTAEGIAPGDRDGSYDVYDARIPRPGDNPPPEAIPCEGAVCQGPPNVPNLLGQPASEAFNGPGDLTPKPPVKLSRKAPTQKDKQAALGQKLRKALSSCAHRFAHNRSRRQECRRQARHKYGASASRSHTSSRHHNGRGK